MGADFQKLFLIYSFYKLLIKNVLYTTCICNQVKIVHFSYETEKVCQYISGTTLESILLHFVRMKIICTWFLVNIPLKNDGNVQPKVSQ